VTSRRCQHGELVAQGKELQVFGGVAAGKQGEQLRHSMR